jgi:uncharacterized protein YjiS (DUF1127 family)
MENDMTAKVPVIPLAAGSLTRAVAELAAFVARCAKALRHRRDARVLAGLDRHMLADIGLNRADVNDAFSSPFWEDPTELLHERSAQRRRHRPAPMTQRPLGVETGFHRPPTNRPARQIV